MINVESKRITYQTWKYLESFWVDGLNERLSLINRTFLKPIMAHPALFPKPEKSHPQAYHFLNNLDHLDLPDSSHDLILFSPFLQWTQDVPGMLKQAYRSLSENGFFAGCFFGQDTLIELKSVCANLDLMYSDSMQQRFLPTIHTKDAGMLMQRAGFVSPTADIERLSFSVSSVKNLVDCLRNSGFNNSKINGVGEYIPTRMFTHSFSKDSIELYTQKYPNKNGGIEVSVDLIFICGWKESYSNLISS
jgi:SAM-dependent methyltransferase